MIIPLRKRKICTLAREKLLEHDAMHLPVRPKLFAKNLGILVQSFDPKDANISGFLMQVGNSFGIGYSKAIKSEGFQNFTVAHELGHYFIDDHPMAVLKSGQHFSHAGYISRDHFEQEADWFATEFLMPWNLIESLVSQSKRGFSSIKNVADQCQSSLLASAIRYAEVTDESIAAVVSHRGTVEFMTASKSFRQIPGIEWLRRGGFRSQDRSFSAIR
jgi:Zn-dependent peptidase ImmA (M78 family)